MLLACESLVIYMRRNFGAVSIVTVAELVLFEMENPRSLVCQLEWLRAFSGTSGSLRAERLVDDISTRLHRLDPADLEVVTADGEHTELARLLTGIYNGLLDLAITITPSSRCLAGCSHCGAQISVR